MKPIDELTRVTECKIGATWNYATNVSNFPAVLAPGYFSERFADRNMRVADRIEVSILNGDNLLGVADLVVCEVRGKQVMVARREDVTL